MCAVSSTINCIVYVAKTSILFSGSVRMAFIFSMLTSISFSHMYLVTKTGQTMSRTVCWAYFFGSGATLFVTRHFVLKLLLQVFIDERFYDITESHLIGAFLFTWSIALLPLSVKYMRDVPLVQRINALVSVLGALWGLWQPSIESLLIEDTPSAFMIGTSTQDVLIALSVLLALVSMLNIGSVNRFAAFRFITLFTVTTGISIAFCTAYLSHSPLIASIVLCVSVLFSATTEFVAGKPIRGSYTVALIAYALHLLCMPIVYLLVGQQTMSPEQQLEFINEGGTDSATMLLMDHQQLDMVRTCRIAVLSLYAIISILLAISIKFKVRFLEDYKNNEQESRVRDIGLVGNCCTVIGYVLSVALTTWIGPENIYTVYIALSTICLLLNRDNLLSNFQGIEWTESHRYTLTWMLMQLTMVALFVLDTTSLFTENHIVIMRNFTGEELTLKDMSIRATLTKAFIHIFLFLISVPSQLLTGKFLFTLKRPNLKICLTLCLPLSLLTCLLTNPYQFSSLYFWGGSAIAGILLQTFVSTQFVRLDVLNGLLG